MSNQISCPSCNASNSIDVGFCNSCGKSLLQKCRYCGTSNPISASFCKNCGAKLSTAIFGLPQEQIKKIDNFTSTFPGYVNVYLRYKPQLEQMIKDTEPDNPQWETIINHYDDYKEFHEWQGKFQAFYFLIADQDWQVNKVIVDNKSEIKHGYFRLTNICIAIRDLNNKRKFRLYHERMSKAERYNDVLRILYSDGHFIDLYFRVPRTRVSAKVLNGFFSLLRIATEDNASDYERFQDDKFERERNQRQLSQDEWADSYIQGWFDFLNIIINEKNTR